MRRKSSASGKKVPRRKTKTPARSIKNVLKRWRQNREPKKHVEKKNLNAEPSFEPATIPAFTLVDAIKHIFTNRKISEIETLLDSYPADVQQIIAGFLGPSWTVLNPHEEVWHLHKQLIFSQDWKKSPFLFQREQFFRYDVAQSKHKSSDDHEFAKPSKVIGAVDFEQNSISKSVNSKVPVKSSTKKKLHGVATGMIAKLRSAIGESHRNRRKYHMGLASWARNEVHRINKAPIPDEAVRVVFIRHCEGYHNAGLNFGSFSHRDASLTQLGIEQGLCTGAALRAVKFRHVLLSPMTRCLETACMVFYGRWHEFSTLITPLAREFHPFSKMVGNEGSPPHELQERFKDFPQFDFETTISTFPTPGCERLPRRRVARGHVKTATMRRDSDGHERVIRRQVLTSYKRQPGMSPLVDRSAGDCEIAGSPRPQDDAASTPCGKPAPFETLPDNWCDVETVWDVDYRGKKLRQLIGSRLFERQSVVAVVSHSYLFKTAFWGEEEMLNCEFRGFDIFPDGSFVRCGQKVPKGGTRRGQQHRMPWAQLVKFCDEHNGDKLLRGLPKMGNQEKGEKQLLSFVATKTPEVGGRFILDIATRRLVHVSGSTYDKHTMRITPSTQAFHRYKGKNLACFFIDQCPGKTHDDASQSLKERLSPTTAPTRTRSEAFVDGMEASSQTVEDGFEASVAPHAEASSTSIRRPVWSLTAPSVRLKMLWISAINSLAALPDSAIPAPKELISGTMQVSTRLPTAFKMRTVTLRRHVGRSGFLLARDSQFKKVFELWVSQCTTVKTSTKRCEFSVRTHSITWRFRPQDEAERDEWMRHINSFVSKSTTL